MLDPHVIPSYGELIPLAEFVAAVQGTAFVDDDGTGYYASEAEYDRGTPARPSEIYERGPLGGYTHVMWFNK